MSPIKQIDWSKLCVVKETPATTQQNAMMFSLWLICLQEDIPYCVSRTLIINLTLSSSPCSDYYYNGKYGMPPWISLRLAANLLQPHPFLCIILLILLFCNSARSFRSTLDKLESKLAMPAGSCIAWSTESNQMVRCPLTRHLEEEMIPLTLFSVKLELENMFLELCLQTWNPLL